LTNRDGSGVEAGHHDDLFIIEGRRLLEELKSFASH